MAERSGHASPDSVYTNIVQCTYQYIDILISRYTPIKLYLTKMSENVNTLKLCFSIIINPL